MVLINFCRKIFFCKKNILSLSVSWYGVRHTQMLLVFAMLTLGFATRVVLSVGIRAMTDPTASTNPDVPTYKWENTSTILSAFFWGYMLLQILAGSLAQKYGPKWFLVAAMGLNCLAALMIPTMADVFGSAGVIVCRVLQGLCQGFFLPSSHVLLGRWVPASERSILGTFIYGGPSFGTIFGMAICGVISRSSVGWPGAFYFFGSMGLTWTCIWCLFGYSAPGDHPTISEKEKHFIQPLFKKNEERKKLTVPWKHIFTSLPMWAIIVAQSGHDWALATLLTQIPAYINKVLGFSMQENGLLSSAPYLAKYIVALLVGPISDFLINRRIFSRGTSRKVFHSIGVLVPALALVLLSFVPENNVSISIMLLIIAVGANGAVLAGFQINHVDLSTNFSGILIGITDTVTNIFSMSAPLAVQLIVPDDKQHQQSLWRIVFLISAALYVVTDIFYIIFASGETQSWNDLGSKEDTKSLETENPKETYSQGTKL